MAQCRYRVFGYHTRPGVAHRGADLFPHLGAVAVRRALFARLFPFFERTPRQTLQRIAFQGVAFVAQPLFLVVGGAVHTDHQPHNPLFSFYAPHNVGQRYENRRKISIFVPMDYRLKVFLAVAHRLSFTKAAGELHISQPAVSKHIAELETHYGVQLFERVGGRIRLTGEGELFVSHAEAICESYRELAMAMNRRAGRVEGRLAIGASSTIAQYVLPRLLAAFVKRYPDVRLDVCTGNSEAIEEALEAHRIELGLVEGRRQRAGLRYTPWRKDELVLVTSTLNTPPSEEVTPSQLCALPLVVRERGSGTLEVIEEALAAHGLKLDELNILLQLGSTESIKLFLTSSPSAYAIVSVAAVARELMDNRLRIVETPELDFGRKLSLVSLHGAQNSLAERLADFLQHNRTL